MNPYASVTYYRNKYNGEFAGTDEQLYILLETASMKIDSLTFNRIVEIGFDNLSCFQKELVEKACCYQADYIQVNGIENENAGFSGYSVLDIKITIDSSTPRAMAQKENASVMAYMLLQQTGLMCKAVG